MKKMFLLAGILATVLFGVSCSKDDAKQVETNTYQFKSTEKIEALNIEAAKNVIREAGAPVFEGYQKYSFAENAVVDSDHWDIAFKGSEIIANGGEAGSKSEVNITGNVALYIADGTLESVTSVDLSRLKNHEIKPNDWRKYDIQTHMVTPLAGKIIVIKTHDGKYVKMRIDSYYKDKGDQNPGATHQNTVSGYYSFTFIKG